MESALPSWHSTRNIHSNPVQGCKYNFSISLVLFPSCPQEQSGTCCKREGKTKVGRSVAVPGSQPALPKAVFFTALAASFSAPHRIPRAQTFLPSRRATVSWLAKVQTSHAGISFWRKEGRATDNPDNDLGFLYSSLSGTPPCSPGSPVLHLHNKTNNAREPAQHCHRVMRVSGVF